MYNYINFLKGIAIISVILTHIIPLQTRKDIFNVYYIIQGVPIFMFLSGYLLSKKICHTDKIFRIYFSYKNVSKLLYTFILPFIILAFAQYLFLGISIKDLLIAGGAQGPGGYYFFLYIQVWISIPFFAFIHRKATTYSIVILLILIQIILFNINIPDWIYRFTIIRHLLLIYIGVFYQSNNIKLISLFQKKHIRSIYLYILFILSIYVLYFVEYHYKPHILLPKSWVWFSYVTDPYVFLYINILLYIYKYLHSIAKNIFFIIEVAGKHSLSILLTHITCITFLNDYSWKNAIFCILIAFVLELKQKYNYNKI
ncbi:MAG: acyltransferase family protein [Brevinemataceae bacterium]